MTDKDWIPASIPPAQDGLYLTTVHVNPFKFMQILDFKDGIWCAEYNDITVLAWQPLPALYKAGD